MFESCRAHEVPESTFRAVSVEAVKPLGVEICAGAHTGEIYEAAGEHELKGVPDSWSLYRVLD
jgi:hypothetical protein